MMGVFKICQKIYQSTGLLKQRQKTARCIGLNSVRFGLGLIWLKQLTLRDSHWHGLKTCWTRTWLGLVKYPTWLTKCRTSSSPVFRSILNVKYKCKEACIALCYMKLHLVALRHGPCLYNVITQGCLPPTRLIPARTEPRTPDHLH